MPATKYFYRLEHKTTHEGPYRHSSDSFVDPNPDLDSIYSDNIVSYIMRETGADFTMDNPNCPTPFNDWIKGELLADKVPKPQYGSVFGFRSIAQTRKWWGTNPKVYDLFEKNNFVLRRYKTNERYDGNKQAVAFFTTLTDGKIIPFTKVLPAPAKPIE